jgi:hypothetical protein
MSTEESDKVYCVFSVSQKRRNSGELTLHKIFYRRDDAEAYRIGEGYRLFAVEEWDIE